jgi:uncharacterized membrane protein
VDDDIEELKELVKQNLAATEESNRMLRKIRRSARWAWILQLVWWVVIAVVTGAAYYYYVQPYVQKIEHLYGLSKEQTQSFNDQVTNFLKFFNQQGAGSGQSAPQGTSTASTTR